MGSAIHQRVCFLLVLSIYSLGLCKIYPCSRVRCPHGRQCVMHPLLCYSKSCSYKAMCVPAHHHLHPHTIRNRHPVPHTKDGECPNLTGSVLPFCHAKCSTDMDCHGSRKCCGVCPRICSEPIYPVHRKSGKCPKSRPRRMKCEASCISDSECPGKLKCCGGCSKRCTPPVL